jgi:hypothetical protein
MQQCSYELYLSVFQAVRQGFASGDADIIRRVTMDTVGRGGVTSLVTTLAIIEAKRGDPERSKDDVCNGVLCRERCATWAACARRAHRASG